MSNLEFGEDFTFSNLNQKRSEYILKSYGVDIIKTNDSKEDKVEKAMSTSSTPGFETAKTTKELEKAETNKKVKKVMDEWKSGELKSGSGQKVTDQKQAIAIALHEAGLSKAEATGKELDELIEEHKDLIDILESPSHEDDKKEAKDQKKELEQYQDEKIKKAFEILGIK